MNHPPPHEEPAEHLRFAAYLHALGQLNADDETALITQILADPDQTMAQSAVLRYLDRRATDLHLGPAYEPWALTMLRATSRYPLLTRRLREWSLYRAIVLKMPWTPDALREASDWLQRKTAATSNMEALAILAEHGRTKRIRNTARTNPTRPGTH